MSLSGVSINEVGSQNTTITDQHGAFTLSVDDLQSTLRFSFAGYQTQEVEILGQTRLSVSLEATSTQLDEIVIVGYGTQKKVNLTGAVQTLQLDSVVNTPVTNSAQLMYGRFSGVQLTQGGGMKPILKVSPPDWITLNYSRCHGITDTTTAS